MIIGPIFKARDLETFGITSEKIAEISKHPNIQTVQDINEIVENCLSIVKNYDTVVVMGAGESYKWAKEIYEKII